MQSIQILVIDDDQDICEYMELVLRQCGYGVQTMTQPRHALDLLRQEQFHVVILDLMMPQLSGIELLEQLRTFDSDIAVIVFTGHPSVDTAVASLKYKVSDYLKKPFSLDELTESLDRILHERGLIVDPEEQMLATVGKNIRFARKEMNLTLKQMSRRTGLSVSLLSQIERAESSASVSSLYKIARALEKRLTELFGHY